MKKIRFFSSIIIIASVMYSCSDGHSRKYTAMDKSLISLVKQIQVTDSCDDLQMLNFGILGLKTDFEKLQQEGSLSESETYELAGRLLELDKVWSEKLTSIDCDQMDDVDGLNTSDDDSDVY